MRTAFNSTLIRRAITEKPPPENHFMHGKTRFFNNQHLERREKLMVDNLARDEI